MVETVVIDFEKDLNITEIKEKVNLFMFNSPLFTFQDLKTTNELFNMLKNVKIEVNIN